MKMKLKKEHIYIGGGLLLLLLGGRKKSSDGAAPASPGEAPPIPTSPGGGGGSFGGGNSGGGGAGTSFTPEATTPGASPARGGKKPKPAPKPTGSSKEKAARKAALEVLDASIQRGDPSPLAADNAAVVYANRGGSSKGFAQKLKEYGAISFRFEVSEKELNTSIAKAEADLNAYDAEILRLNKEIEQLRNSSRTEQDNELLSKDLEALEVVRAKATATQGGLSQLRKVYTKYQDAKRIRQELGEVS